MTGIGLSAPRAQASELREFLMSCAYGAGIGALAGTTLLAFSDKPSENLNSIARGASLGLYAGAAVGLYWAYRPQPEASASNSSYSYWIAPQITREGVATTAHYRFEF